MNIFQMSNLTRKFKELTCPCLRSPAERVPEEEVGVRSAAVAHESGEAAAVAAEVRGRRQKLQSLRTSATGRSEAASK